MGELLVESGAMSEAEAERAGLDNVLSSALGAEITPALGLDLAPGDQVLLCSDGLTKHVPDPGIQAILEREPSAEAACGALTAAALDGGGSDNITVVVARAP